MGGKTRKIVFFNSFCSIVAKKVARFCCLFFRSFIPVNIFIIKLCARVTPCLSLRILIKIFFSAYTAPYTDILDVTRG